MVDPITNALLTARDIIRTPQLVVRNPLSLYEDASGTSTWELEEACRACLHGACSVAAHAHDVDAEEVKAALFTPHLGGELESLTACLASGNAEKRLTAAIRQRLETCKLNEQHAAHIPETTLPAEPTANMFAIHYKGEPFRLDEHALQTWLNGGDWRTPYAPGRTDPESGSAAARLFDAAIQRQVIVTPAGLSAEMYADDDEIGGGFTLVVYPTPSHHGTGTRRGVTTGWRDVSLIAAGEDEQGDEPKVIRAAMQALTAELNCTLGDRAR
jgi:hypothetical protein